MLISRAELFDLVWSQPRTTLAARFKVSDVAVAKRCRAANIPMPPPGYWARVAAGAKAERPTLPLRIPGERDVVAFGEPRYESPLDKADGEPQPPIFAEDVDALVNAAAKQLGRVKAQRDLADPHGGLARILRKEQQRRQKFSETSWSFYKPEYDDPASQRQLRLYSALFRTFSKIGIKGVASEREQWKQGAGTTRHLSAGLEFSGAWVELSFAPLETTGKATGLTLLVGGDTEAKAHSAWSDEARLPLERQLDAIARGILVCAEQHMRHHAQQLYEWKLKDRARRAREQEEHRRAEEVKRAAQIERQQKLRREAVHAAAARRQRSIEIRSLVADLVDAHPELSQDASFAGWCEFALGEADRIDPVRSDWTEFLKVAIEPVPSSPSGTA